MALSSEKIATSELQLPLLLTAPSETIPRPCTGFVVDAGSVPVARVEEHNHVVANNIVIEGDVIGIDRPAGTCQNVIDQTRLIDHVLSSNCSITTSIRPSGRPTAAF